VVPQVAKTIIGIVKHYLQQEMSRHTFKSSHIHYSWSQRSLCLCYRKYSVQTVSPNKL